LINCRSKKHYALVRLPKRVMNFAMPEMRLVDLRCERPASKGMHLISEPLAAGLREALLKGEQAILLLNRRGYSNFVYCPSCRHTLGCRNCDAKLTFHKSPLSAANRVQTVTGRHLDYGHALCHYCLSQTLVPERCPLCGGRLAMIGMGSQRLEEELKSRFPRARTQRIDSDSMRGADYYGILRDFAEGRIDILAGTQMLAKGLHFPNVTVVGIISADTSLYVPDFRSNERTFQLISQVAGRTGRSEQKGRVFVQTLLAEQAVIRYAISNDFEGFAAEELKHRKACNLPPFGRLAAVLMRDTNFEKLEEAAAAMRERLDFLIGHHRLSIKVRGPMPAVISRIQTFHRMQIILQAAKAEDFVELFGRLRSAAAIRPAVKTAIDVDPVNLL
jgi:primosomal protein N' (replication factor Y)